MKIQEDTQSVHEDTQSAYFREWKIYDTEMHNMVALYVR